jgi:hypothetical protein
MPLCPNCHIAAVAVVQSASAVRDLGVAGAVSIAAASALGIAHKRGLFDGPIGMPHDEQTIDSGVGNEAPDSSVGRDRCSSVRSTTF